MSRLWDPCLRPLTPSLCSQPLGNQVGIHRLQTSKTIVVSLLTFFFLNAMTVFFFFDSSLLSEKNVVARMLTCPVHGSFP